jgi:hypothetical protein
VLPAPESCSRPAGAVFLIFGYSDFCCNSLFLPIELFPNKSGIGMVTHSLKKDILYVHLSEHVNGLQMLDSFRYRLEHFGSGISTIVTFDKNLHISPAKKDFLEQFRKIEISIRESRPRWMIFYVFQNRPEIQYFIDFLLSTFDTRGSFFWKTESVEKAEGLINGLRKSGRIEQEGFIPLARASV